jgi:hypothetical protein
MQCEEAERLKAADLEASAAVNEAAKTAGLSNPLDPAWKLATRRARADSRSAADALKYHRREHGC